MNKKLIIGVGIILVLVFNLGMIIGMVISSYDCPELSENNCKIIKPIEYVEKECNCSCPAINCFEEIDKAITDYRLLEGRFEK